MKLKFAGDVVEARILRPRPQPSRPGPSRLRPGPEASALKAWTFETETKARGPETKAFMHTAIEEIKICSTSDSQTG